jgi:hypothetical protein
VVSKLSLDLENSIEQLHGDANRREIALVSVGGHIRGGSRGERNVADWRSVLHTGDAQGREKHVRTLFSLSSLIILKKFLALTALWITIAAWAHSLHSAMYLGLWYAHLHHFNDMCQTNKPIVN